MNYNIDNKGYYGQFGGTYVTDEIKFAVDELRKNYLQIMNNPKFKKEFEMLLHDYVGRPTPLTKAINLSQHYGCKIYLKREDLNHTGAHKINNALGQVLMARNMGRHHVIAETGAGQHGVAVATACALLELHCTIFMGRKDADRQKLNVEKIKMLGGQIHIVEKGGGTLNDATREALRYWAANTSDTYYIISSVIGPHPFPDIVARLQSVISHEIKAQLLHEEGRDYPDYLMACVGGGSNASGTLYHYLDDDRVQFLLAEAAGCSLHNEHTAAAAVVGIPDILHGSRTLAIEDKAGNIIPPSTISAGLGYPGMGPMHANLAISGRAEFYAITDNEALHAGHFLSREEGIIPAIESAHVLAVLEKKHFSNNNIVVLTISGRGDKDIESYKI